MVAKFSISRLHIDMQSHILDHIISRGYDYFREGMVKEIRFESPWIIATVLGNYGVYEVKVHTANFGKSTCNCPYEGYCKHIAAVVFTSDTALEHCSSDTPSSSIAPVQQNIHSATGPEMISRNKQEASAWDSVESRLVSLEKTDLITLLKLIQEDRPSITETIGLILNEWDRQSQHNSQKVRQMGLYTSLAYYQKEILEVIAECESMFEILEPSDDLDCLYDPEDDPSEWNFEAGLARVDRYLKDLFDLVTPLQFISGTVGLMIAVIELKKLVMRYDDEINGYELSDACSLFEDYLWQALEFVKEYRLKNGDAQTFLDELVEWMILQCNTLDDLADWTYILSHCVETTKDLWHLQERIRRIDSDFPCITSAGNDQTRFELIAWWVQLCLSLDLEKEANRTANYLNSSQQLNNSIAYTFIRFYERKERWLEAYFTLRNCLLTTPRLSGSDYEWIIRIAGQAGKAIEQLEWYEKYFLVQPNFELYKKASLHLTPEDKPLRLQNWIMSLQERHFYSLIIDIYLFEKNTSAAWQEFEANKHYFLWDEATLSRLFYEIKITDPAKLIPHFHGYVMEHIERRKRSGYAKAAKWLKDLFEVCVLSGHLNDWEVIYSRILTNYKRFPALMDELHGVGL